VKKYVSLLLVIMLFSLNVIRNTVNHEQQTRIAHALYTEDVHKVNYRWSGRVLEQIELKSQHTSIIPTTFFKVAVVHDDTGSLDDIVVIGYFGGYVGDTLYLLDGMTYPKPDVVYHFQNASLMAISGYQVLLVSAPHHMSESDSYEHPATMSFGPPEDDDGSGGGGGSPYSNTSFQTAISLGHSNGIPSLSILMSFPRYYRFTTNDSTTLVATTTGNTDVTLTLYDSSHNELAFNDDILATDINASLFWENAPSGTYYLKIERKTIGPSENIGLQFDRLIPSLVVVPTTMSPSVNPMNQVVYRDSTNGLATEITYAASIWNTLSTDKIVAESSVLSPTVDIVLSNILDPYTIGLYTYDANGLSTIELNEGFLNQYDNPNQIGRRINLITHELGHALGLEHTPTYRNVMHNDSQSRIALGVYDIVYFRGIWG